MDIYERFDKNIIEKFSLETIAKSYDSKYKGYISPHNTDNFDFISKDMLAALEVTTVIPHNEIEAHKYMVERKKGKKNLSIKKVRDGETKEDGSLLSWYGGGMNEIKNKILLAIQRKNDIAISRMRKSNIKSVDLCVCIVDGGLFDLRSFEIAFSNFNEYIFENIFSLLVLILFSTIKMWDFKNSL